MILTDEILGTVEEKKAQDGRSYPFAHNAWPDLALVKVTEVDPTDPYAMFTFGQLFGRADKRRQVFHRCIPPEVPLHSPYVNVIKREGHGTSNVRFTWADPKGQEDTLPRNVLALIEPPKRWQPSIDGPARYVLVHPAVIVELGCVHEYVVIAKGNCYTRQQCTQCQHIFAIDSGD